MHIENIFDKRSHQFLGNTETDAMFLRAAIDYHSHLLKARGHLFLNEMYDHLGIPRTRTGAVEGWVAKFDQKPSMEIIAPEEEGGPFILIFNVYNILYELED